jgi:DNA-binding NarL/FixJ family response regulator
MVLGKISIWLAGPSVSEDWDLVRALVPDHAVTLIGPYEPGRLPKEAAMRYADLMVVDCGTGASACAPVFKAIRAVKKRFPRLIVLLVYSRLEPSEIAEAYKVGVEDVYPSDFPSPGRAQLLAEKIVALCERRPG